MPKSTPRATIDPAMTPTPIHVRIELDPTAEPITGTLQQEPHGSTKHFHGWLQLTEALQAIRHADAQPSRGLPCDSSEDPPRTNHRTSPPDPDGH